MSDYQQRQIMWGKKRLDDHDNRPCTHKFGCYYMLMQQQTSTFFTAVGPNKSIDESLSCDPNNKENDKSDNSSASESDQEETESIQATTKWKHAFQTQNFNDLMVFKG